MSCHFLLWVLIATSHTARAYLVSSAAELVQGLASSATVFEVAADLTFSDSPFPGASPSTGLFTLTRSINIRAVNSSVNDFYPSVDFNNLRSAKIVFGAGVTISFQHLKFELASSSWLGYKMAIFDASSTGLLQVTDCAYHVSVCPAYSSINATISGAQRPAAFPGTQQVQMLPSPTCFLTKSQGGPSGGGGPGGPSGGGGPGGDPPGGRQRRLFSRKALQAGTPSSAPVGYCFNIAFRWVDAAYSVPEVYGSSQLPVPQYQAAWSNFSILCNEMSSSGGAPGGGNGSGGPVRAPPPSPAEVAATVPADDSSVSGAVIGAAVGAAVGGVLLLAAIAALVVWRRRTSRPKDDHNEEDATYVQLEFARKISEHHHTSPGVSTDQTMDDSAASVPDELKAKSDMMGSSSSKLDMMSELNELSRTLESTIADNQLVIQSVIGSGTFGTVYRGTWQGLTVAVKSLVFSSDVIGADSNDKKRRMLMEAALSKSIANANVVATYAYDLKLVPVDKDLLASGSAGLSVRTEGNILNYWRLFIIQELCDGGSFFSMLQARAAGGPKAAASAANVTVLAEVLELAIGLANGMIHLHDRNVIHGDLNPANVLLKSEATGRMLPKVCDFGFSVLLPVNKSHVSNVHRGTPFYMAPEVLKAGSLSKAADVYAMGVMLWELFMGCTVYKMDSSGHTMLRSTFPRLAAPPQYSKLVASCLSKDPTQRPTFSSIAETLGALRSKLHASTGKHSAATAAPATAEPSAGSSTIATTSEAPAAGTAAPVGVAAAALVAPPPAGGHTEAALSAEEAASGPRHVSLCLEREAHELGPKVERWLDVRSM